MNDFTFILNDVQYSLLINKNNSILYYDKKSLLTFYKLFYDCLVQKQNTEIVIEYKNVTPKEFRLINLMDIESILKMNKYQKDSILYDYIQEKIGNIEASSKELYDNIYDFFSNIIDINVDLITNENINKLFNAVFDVLPLNNKKEYILLKLLKTIIIKNPTTNFIIFYDSSFLDLQIDENNICKFDVSTKNDIKKYNIFLTLEDIKCFNYNLLLEQIMNEYPIEYNKDTLIENINNYFKYYFGNSTIDTLNIDIALIAKIIDKLYSLNQNIVIKNSMNNIIKSFLST